MKLKAFLESLRTLIALLKSSSKSLNLYFKLSNLSAFYILLICGCCRSSCCSLIREAINLKLFVFCVFVLAFFLLFDNTNSSLLLIVLKLRFYIRLEVVIEVVDIDDLAFTPLAEDSVYNISSSLQ